MADQIPNDDAETPVEETETPAADTSVSDQLHIAGKGFDALDDGTERGDGNPIDPTTEDEVFSNANIQSGRRTTYEQMVGGQPNEGETLADQTAIPSVDYQGSEPDNSVDAAFEAPQPNAAAGFTPPEIGVDSVPPAPIEINEAPEDAADDEPPAPDGIGDPAPEAETPPQQPQVQAPPPPPPEELPVPEDDPLAPPVAEQANLAIQPSNGTEDLPLKLDLVVSSGDTDGDETLTVNIGDVPDGFSFVNGNGDPIGTQGGDGSSWTFSTAEANDLWLVRPEHWSGDLTFPVTVTSTETTGETVTVSQDIDIHVEAVADAPVIDAQDLALTEGEPIPLDITAGLVDGDGSESMTVYLTGLPDDASLNHGSQLTEAVTVGGVTMPAGTWVIDPADLGDLSVSLPANVSDDMNLNAYAATTEDMNGDVAITGPAPIHIDIGVRAPDVAGTGEGAEHAWIDLDLSAQVVAADGTETMTVFIEDLPAEAELRRTDTGEVLTPDAEGTFDITGLTDVLQVRWQQDGEVAHSDDDISFNLRAVVEDIDVGTGNETDRDTNQAVTPVTVAVNAVVDAPSITASDVGGLENSWITVAVDSLSIGDLDGSESLSVYIENVPDGAELRIGGGLSIVPVTEDVTLSSASSNATRSISGDGTTYRIDIPNAHTMTPDQLAAQLETLQVRAADDSSADMQLNLVAVATEERGQADYGAPEQAWAEAGVHVDVGVVDPTVTASNATGDEGEWAALTALNVAPAAVSDGMAEETLTVTVTNLTDGAELAVDNGDGTYTTLTPTDGVYDVTAQWDAATGNVNNLVVRWADSDQTGDITLKLNALVEDLDITDGGDADALGSVPNALGDGTADAAFDSTDVSVYIGPVVDDATVDLTGDNGLEDAGTPGDTTDGIAVTPEITLSGDDSESLTGDVVFTFDAANAAEGNLVWVPAVGGPNDVLTDVNGDGTEWTLDSSVFVDDGSGTLVIDATQGSLIFVPTEHTDADVDYGFTFTVDDQGVTKDFDATGTIGITAVADDLVLASGGAGDEDNYSGAINVDLTVGLVDQDGSEALTGNIEIVFDADGVAAGKLQLDGVNLVGVADGEGNTVFSIPADSDAVSFDAGTQTYSVNGLTFVPGDDLDNDVTYTVRATVLDNDNSEKTTEITGRTIDVKAVADDPTLTAHDVGGVENSWIPVALDSLALTDATNESLTLYVSGVPDGAELQIAGGGATIEPVTSAVTLNSASGAESDSVPALPGDGSVYKITISSAAELEAVKSNLQIKPAEDSSVDFSLKLVAVAEEANGEADYDGAKEQAWTTADVHVDVGVADPDVTATGTTGTEGSWTALTALSVVPAALSDGMTEETVTVTVTGLSDGAELAIDNGDGTYTTLTPTDGAYDVTGQWDSATGSVDNLVVRWADDDATGDISLTLNATVEDTDLTQPGGDADALGSVPNAAGDGTPDAATDSATITVSVTPVVDDATVDLTGDGGKEDNDTPAVAGDGFAVTPEITLSGDDTEALTGDVTFTFDVANAAEGDLVWTPAPGFTDDVFTDVNGNGTEYTLDSSVFTEVDGKLVIDASKGSLTFVPKEHTDVDVDYGFSFTVDDQGVTKDFSGNGTIAIEAVADALDIEAIAAGNEDTTITLNPTITLIDQDGSEALKPDSAVTITTTDADMAAGTLTLGGVEVTPTYDADSGTWTYTFSENDLTFDEGTQTYTFTEALEFTPELHSDEEIAFDLSATVLDNDGSEKTTTGAGTITVTAVADDLVLASGGAGDEDNYSGAINVDLTVGLVDQDDSEALTGNIEIVFDADGVAAGKLQLDGVDLVGVADGEGNTVFSIPADSDAVSFDAGTQTYSVNGLTFVPGDDLDNDVTYTVRATVLDNDDSEKTTEITGRTIDVKAVADDPTLTAHDVGGVENSWIPVALDSLALTDATNESLTLYVSGVPDGAELQIAGGGATIEPVTSAVTLNSASGAESDSVPALPGDGSVYKITISSAAELEAVKSNLQIKPAEDSSADFSLKLVAVAEEANGEADYDGAKEQAWTTADVHVDVGVADPTVTGSDTTGTEGSWTAVTDLTVTPAALSENMTEETVTVTIANLTDGAELAIDNGDGTYTTLTPTDGVYDVTGQWDSATGSVDNLVVRWADDDATGDITMQLKAVVEDTDLTQPGGDADALGSVPNAAGDGTPDAATDSATITVSVTPVVDDATVDLTGDGGKEDNDTPAVAGDGFAVTPEITLSGDDTEALTGDVTFTFDAPNAAEGDLVWTPAPGFTDDVFTDVNGDGTEYTLDSSVFTEVDGKLVIDASKGSLTFVPKEHTDVDVDYGFSFTVDDQGVTKDFSGDGTIAIEAVADELTIVADATGNEDTAIALNPTITLIDQDGSEALKPGSAVTITTTDADMADGTLTLGGVEVTPTYDADSGTWTYTFSENDLTFDEGTQTYTFTEALEFTPDQHSDEEIDFQISATVLDNDNSEKTTTGSGTITVKAVADADPLTASDTGVLEHGADAAATEGWVEIAIDTLGPVDTDGSESLTLYVQGVPEGAQLGYGPTGEGTGPTITAVTGDVALNQASTGASATLSAATGTVTYKIEVSSDADLAAVKDNLFLRPADNSSADIDLTLTSVSTEANGATDWDGAAEQAWDQASVHIDVGVVTPEVTAGNETGDEASWTPMDALSVDIGALTTTNLADLKAGTGEETVTITIEGLSDGAILRHGNDAPLTPDGNGNFDVTDYWDPQTGTVSGLSVKWADNDQAGDITFNLKAHLIDLDQSGDFDDIDSTPDAAGVGMADETADSATVTVTITPRAEDAVVSSDAVGLEDNYVPLNISASAQDSSEDVVAASITGLGDATLWKWDDFNGVYVEQTATDGVYDLDVDALGDYALLPAQHSNEDLTLSLSVTTEESANNDQHTQTYDVPVTIFGDVDQLVDGTDGDVDETHHVVDEDAYYQVTFADTLAGIAGDGSGNDVFAKLIDADTSETLSFRIETDVVGARLRIDGSDVEATEITDGSGAVIGYSWDIPADDLANDRVSLAGPEDWGADDSAEPISFRVIAKTQEDDANADDSALNGREDHAGNALDGRVTEAETDIGVLNLVIDPKADDLTIAAWDSGIEDDDAISVTPKITVQDTDGSEVLSGSVYFVTSDPDMLAGVLTYTEGGVSTEVKAHAINGYDSLGNPQVGAEVANPALDGSTEYVFELPNDWFQRSGDEYAIRDGALTFAPADDNDGDATYDIYATSKETAGTGIDATDDYKVSVKEDAKIRVQADADAPTLTTSDAAGMENTAIALDITALLNDTDGSESLTVYLTGIPEGATLSLLDTNGDPITLSHSDGAQTIAAGSADVGIAEGDIDIAAGAWSFTVDSSVDLSSLTVTPPTDDSADFQIGVTAVATEGASGGQVYDKHEVAQGTIFVDVGTAAPTLVRNSTDTAGDFTITAEEYTSASQNWTSLDLDAALPNQDGTETFNLHLNDVPDGAAIRYHNGSNWVTVNEDGAQEGHYVVPGDYADTIQIRTPYNDDDDFTITAQARVDDVDAFKDADDYADNQTHYDDENHATAPDSGLSAPISITVAVSAEADKANVSANGIGVEDKWFDLNVDWSLKDTDGSETITAVELEGLPNGTQLQYRENGTGDYVSIDADNLVILDDAERGTLQAKWPADLNSWSDSNHDVDLQLKVTTTETGVDGDTDTTNVVSDSERTTTKNFNVKVFGDADQLVDGTDAEVDETVHTIDEDAFYQVTFGGSVGDVDNGTNDVFAALVDSDGSESLTFTITTTQLDARLAIDTDGDGDVDGDDVVAGTLSNDGQTISWDVTYDQLANNKIFLGGDENWASDGTTPQIAFDVAVTTTEDDAGANTSGLPSGLTREASATTDIGTITLTIDPVADAVVVSTTAIGNEDEAIAVTPVIEMVDSDGSEQLTQVYLLSSDSDATAGTFTLNGVELTAQKVTHYAADGTPQFDGAGDEGVWAWDITDAFPDGAHATYTASNLTFQGALHSDNEVTYKIASTVMDSNGQTLTTTTPNHTITVKAVADAPTVDMSLNEGGGGTDPKTWDEYDFPIITSVKNNGSTQQHDLSHVVLFLESPDGDSIFKVKIDNFPDGVPDADTLDMQSFLDAAYPDHTIVAVGLKAGNNMGDTDGEMHYLDPDRYDADNLPVVADGENLGATIQTTYNFNAVFETDGDYIGGADPNEAEGPHVDRVYDADPHAVGGGATSTTTTITETAPGEYLVTGNEDQNIDLGISAELVDTDGSETIVGLTLDGVPDGWVVRYVDGDGDHHDLSVTEIDGQWDLSAAQDFLSSVYVKAPKHYHTDGTDDLTLTVTTGETNPEGVVEVLNASTTATFSIVVEAEADAPNLTVNAARTAEDTAVKLDILPALVDTDGSETLTVFISGDFKGGTLVDGNGTPVGTWDADEGGYQIDLAQLDDLYFDPKADSNEDPALTVLARATDADGSTADRTVPLNITVVGVVDGVAEDDLRIDVDEPTTGTAATVNLGFGELTALDTDGSETVSVVIKNIPDSINVTMAAGDGGADMSDYMKYIGGGKWAVDADHVQYVQATVLDPDFSGEITLDVDLVVTENDGASKTFAKTLTLDVEAEADMPSVSVSAKADEDAPGGVPIGIGFSVADTVAGDETIEAITHVTIDIDPASVGLPTDGSLTLALNGETIAVDGGTEITLEIVNGTVQFNGVALDGVTEITPDLLDGLTLQGLPGDWSDNIPMSVAVTAQDADGSEATKTVDTQIRILADADAPDFEITTADGTSAPENQAIQIDMSLATHEIDGTEFADFYVIEGVSNGVALNVGTNIGGGTWLVSASDLANNGPLTATSEFEQTVNLTINVKVLDDDNDAGDRTDSIWASDTVSLEFTDTNGDTGASHTVEPPTITVHPWSGDEDTALSLSDAVTISANGDGDTLTAIIVTDLNGGSLSGPHFKYNGQYIIDPADIDQITVTPPTNLSGEWSLDVKAVAQDGGLYAESAVTEVTAEVMPVTDGGSFSIGLGTGADTTEDAATAISLDVSLALSDALGNGGEEVVVNDNKVTVTLDQAETEFYVDGVKQFDDGSHTFEIGLADIDKLSIRPPAHFSGSVGISLAAEVLDTVTINGVDHVADTTKAVTGSASITVTAVAEGTATDSDGNGLDDLRATVSDVTGNEDSLISLTGLSAMTDDLKGTDAHDYGSEYLSVTISGVPEGAIILGAANNGSYTETVNGEEVTFTSWTIKGANIAADGSITGVSVLPPADWAGSMDLTLTAYAMEKSNKDVSSISKDFTVTVDGVSDTPTVNPSDVSGKEDQPVKLELNVDLVDASEVLTVTISDVPDGAKFTDAAGNDYATTVPPLVTDNGDGTWEIDPSILDALYFVGPANVAETFEMGVTATSQDTKADGTPVTAAVSGTVAFTVALSGVADIDGLTVSASQPGVTVAEDSSVELGVSAALGVDQDGSETLTLLISGAPVGTTFLTAGGGTISAQDGVWTVSAADIPGLKIAPPADYFTAAGGDPISLTLTARASEDGTTAETWTTLDVTVTAENDVPTVEIAKTAYGASGDVSSPIHVVPRTTGGEHIEIGDAIDGTTTLSKMTIAISDGAGAGDSLGLSGYEPVMGANGKLQVTVDDTTFDMSYDSATNTMTFTGVGSHEAYESLAESVILTSSTDHLDAGARSIDVTVFDEGDLSATASSTVTIGAGGADLSDAARGDVFFSGGMATLTGTDGDDLFVFMTDDSGYTVHGGAGADSMAIFGAAGDQGGDWVYIVDNDNGIVHARETAEGEDVFTIELKNGTEATVEDGTLKLSNGTEEEPQETQGEIKFDDQTVVAFDSIESLIS